MAACRRPVPFHAAARLPLPPAWAPAGPILTRSCRRRRRRWLLLGRRPRRRGQAVWATGPVLTTTAAAALRCQTGPPPPYPPLLRPLILAVWLATPPTTALLLIAFFLSVGGLTPLWQRHGAGAGCSGGGGDVDDGAGETAWLLRREDKQKQPRFRRWFSARIFLPFPSFSFVF